MRFNHIKVVNNHQHNNQYQILRWDFKKTKQNYYHGGHLKKKINNNFVLFSWSPIWEFDIDYCAGDYWQLLYDWISFHVTIKFLLVNYPITASDKCVLMCFDFLLNNPVVNCSVLSSKTAKSQYSSFTKISKPPPFIQTCV
jgi:hypothetical protein